MKQPEPPTTPPDPVGPFEESYPFDYDHGYFVVSFSKNTEDEMLAMEMAMFEAFGRYDAAISKIAKMPDGSHEAELELRRITDKFVCDLEEMGYKVTQG